MNRQCNDVLRLQKNVIDFNRIQSLNNRLKYDDGKYPNAVSQHRQTVP